MKITMRNLGFAYSGKPIFENFNAEFESSETGRPVVILGPSGSGKTTLLKLMGGLFKPGGGDMFFHLHEHCSTANCSPSRCKEKPRAAFMFQEPRLLPWLTVLENIRIPLEKDIGVEEAASRASHFLSLVSLSDKNKKYPRELSGGEAQRVSMARAFAWKAPLLLMDEPFQSLDIPLRLSLMDLTMSLLERVDYSQNDHSNKNRFLVAVTHDPREAIYMAGRIIVLGKSGEGIVFDRAVDLSAADRAYGSAAAVKLEKEIILKLEISN